jgi:cytochrome c biogenesis protein CcmG, thiol:disulfide interchange protein DsbE
MFKYLIPLFLFLILTFFLAIGLQLNPREIPSPLLDKPTPGFALPELHNPTKLFSDAELEGKVWVLNVWASWCVSCRAEHPVLNQLSELTDVTIIGLDYKDDPVAAQKWLQSLGNPYDLSVMDMQGRVGIDWGVYGVPETFLMDKKGLIRHKHTGPITLDDVRETLLPLIEQLQAETL